MVAATDRLGNFFEPALRAWSGLVYAFLFLPIVLVVIFSFNSSRLVEVWSGFSLKWYYAIRNADGLIVVSDFDSGFWALKMDGFDGWNGHNWGVPNTSSAQDWDNGPDGAPKPGKIS